jgi:peptidoglycan/xylan/chitin deacetylase (PgdA/CDA1 family)
VLTKLRDSLGLQGKAIFLGGRMDIPDLLAAFDVYVNNSIYEGMSNTILEAMAAGLPVVATNVGGTPAILEDGVTGILIPPRDPQALAGAVQNLFEQAWKRKEYGRRGREFVLRKHSMARMVDRNETCYLDAYCNWRSRSSPLSSSQWFRIAVGHLLDRTGFCRILERAHSGSVTILTYHRVLPTSVKAVTHSQPMIMEERIFKQQIQFLSEKCCPVTMEEALRGLRGECRLPERAVTVTFDDGYRDNFEYAFPTLRRFGVPATIFLSTGVIDEGKSFWWDRFSRVILVILEKMGKEPLAQISFKWPACFREQLDRIGDDADSRLLGVDKMAHDICNLGERIRQQILDDIEIIAERAESEEFQGDTRIVLDWNEIREMSNSGIEFGAHTVTHAYLDEISNGQALSEVRNSAEQILKQTGKRPRVFSYPGGRFNEMAEAVVRSMGFEAAMTAQAGRNVPGCNLFRLRRLDGGYMNVNGHFYRSLMRFEVTSNYRKYIIKRRGGLLACAESPGY